MPVPIATTNYTVEHLGPWRAEDIHIRLDRKEFIPPADRAQLIEQLWQQQQAEASRRGFEMFNGKLARLVSSAFVPAPPGRGRQPNGTPDRDSRRARLELLLQPTDFRTFLATNLIAPERFATDERANAMGISAIVRTADGRLLFGRRSQRVAHNRGRLHTVGGVLDWIRPARGSRADGQWLLDQLGKELYEELTLQPEEIRLTTPLALARDNRIWQPELLCLTEVTIRGDELSARWRQSGEYEHEDLWACHDSPQAIADALARHAGEFTHVALAACVAYMTIRYGDAGLAAMGPA